MSSGCPTAGLFVFVFALRLAAALFVKKPSRDGERYTTMAALVLLVPTLLGQRLPPAVLPLHSRFFAA